MGPGAKGKRSSTQPPHLAPQHPAQPCLLPPLLPISVSFYIIWQFNSSGHRGTTHAGRPALKSPGDRSCASGKPGLAPASSPLPALTLLRARSPAVSIAPEHTAASPSAYQVLWLHPSRTTSSGICRPRFQRFPSELRCAILESKRRDIPCKSRELTTSTPSGD